MSKPKQPSIEYRNYLLPANFPLILLGGEEWRISDIPSSTLHFHNCLEIGLCESDSGMMRFRNMEEPFRAGDVTIVASNIPHTTYSTPGTASKWHYIFVNVEELFFPYFPVEIIGNSDILSEMIRESYMVLKPEEHPDLIALVQSMVDEIQRKENNYEFSIRGLMLSFITRLLNLYMKEQNSEQTNSRSNSLAIAPALHYIRTNYVSDFPMDDLANMCNLSPTHFRRTFGSIMGFGPLEYLNRIRITHATTLLRTTEQSILDISEDVGFHSISSFNRHFSEIVGMTPTNYRKQLSAAGDISIQRCTGWMTPPTNAALDPPIQDPLK